MFEGRKTTHVGKKEMADPWPYVAAV